MITTKQIINEARTWVGTPFHHQGRIKHRGVDCIGIIQQTGAALGLIKYDRKNYGREPYHGELQKEMDNNLDKIKTLKPGCILLIRFAKEPQHAAIYTDKNTIIHAYQNVGKCVEHRLDDKWKKRIAAIYQYRGING